MNELPSRLQDVLNVPSRLVGEENKFNHIVDMIIPAMDRRRGRQDHLDENNIAKKLWSPPNSEKPGEEHELARAMVEHPGSLLEIDEALEIADVVFYYLQPNAPENASREGLELFMFIILGEMSLAYDFCIIKYEARLRFGDMKNYREIEEQAMQEFFTLKGLPENLVNPI